MGREDWFRSEVWDDAARDLFETKLARSRSSNHAQYLRIQGLTLVETADHKRVEAGRGLLRRVLDEYPDEALEVASAYYALGQSLARDQGYDEAIGRLRACLEVEAGKNFKNGAELLLGETLIASAAPSFLDEAWELLDAWEREAVFGSEFWRIEVARARLLVRKGNPQGASIHARNALELLEHDKPTFSRHPTVGRIQADEATIGEMRRLADA
jgi:hypothetical protein